MTTRQILILPAPDCPVEIAETPPVCARQTHANVEYNLLSAAPYALNHKNFTHSVHREVSATQGKEALDFDAFHAKGQPCMRASALTKRYGWAAHYDAEGRLALIDPASEDFARLAADPELPQKPAMRSKRA